MLIATLLQAIVASLLLILLPLVDRPAQRGRRRGRRDRRARAWRSTSRALGFAFMFVEIAFIQKFILFLAHPLYAVAVVLCAFLVFAGLGSRHSPRLRRPKAAGARAHPLAWLVAAIAGIALVYLLALPAIFRQLMPLPDARGSRSRSR